MYLVLFVAPIASAYGITKVGAIQLNRQLTTPLAVEALQAQLTQAVPSDTSGATIQAAQAEPIASPASQTFEYEISLANGFLKKAVNLSNASEVQTPKEKEMIIVLLNQALEAANRAIGINPNDPSGYTSRGHIYQTTSAIKPEMKQLADQDFAHATSLGASNPTQVAPVKNPMELLPTEQATGTSAAMIAEPQNGKTKETVQGETEKNATRGTVMFEAGKTEVFVPYTQVKDTTQLYVNAEKNPENLTLYVKNKEAGRGFTVASTVAPNSPLDITWWEIE